MAVTEQTTTARAREAARALAAASPQAKDSALAEIAAAIERRAGDIIDANRLDLEEAAGQRPSILDRLALDGPRTAALADAVRAVAALPDPIGSVVREFTLENGLRATKLRVPLGVVAIVYEARPNVTVDAAALCLKAGNACVLRGSSLARHTNTALLDVVREGIAAAGLPADAVQALGEDREQLEQFVSDPEAADVVIPRGGEELKKFLLAASRIPVLAAAGGNCHVYVDAAADAAKAVAITVNAKTDRPGVCNAAETLLVHRRQEQLMPELEAALREAGVELRTGEEAWATEFLDMVMAVRVVDSLDEALDHIARYGTGHSEAIVTEDAAAAERFTREVDAAAVYVNASTRFTDGGQYGMGAEIGISTNRLHARGPLGLEELTTTKYVVVGDGQVRE
ncbi:MAG: glutamate-5-semialdehyde dehydrogenase [Gaiellales bacterium]